MKTRVLERAKSNLLLLCASIVTVKNILLNSYDNSMKRTSNHSEQRLFREEVLSFIPVSICNSAKQSYAD